VKPSELPGARRLYRLTNGALAQIRELWQYAGEDELPPDSVLQAQVEALRILRIEVPLSAKRQFQLFCSEHFPGLADIVDCLAADQLWALLSMRVQLANGDQLQAQSGAVRFGGLGRRYVLVAFNDRSVGLLSHADGFPAASTTLNETVPNISVIASRGSAGAIFRMKKDGRTNSNAVSITHRISAQRRTTANSRFAHLVGMQHSQWKTDKAAGLAGAGEADRWWPRGS
jgi:hypothetical protein